MGECIQRRGKVLPDKLFGGTEPSLIAADGHPTPHMHHARKVYESALAQVSTTCQESKK